MIPRPRIGLLLLVVLSVTSACSSTKEDPGTPSNIVAAPNKGEEEVLQNAVVAYDKGLYSVAEEAWTQLRDGFPTSYLQPLAEIKIADSQFFRGEYPTALISYQEFIKAHPGHEGVPYVMFQIANCNLEQYRGVTHDQTPIRSAIKGFQDLVDKFPSSEYVVLARRSIVECREKLAEHEKFVADFYERRGYPDAAARRRTNLATLFADTKSAQASGVAPSSASVPEKQRKEIALSAPELVTARVDADVTQAKLLPRVSNDRALDSNSIVDDSSSSSSATMGLSIPFLGMSCESITGKPVFTVLTAGKFVRSIIDHGEDFTDRIDLVIEESDPALGEHGSVAAHSGCQAEGISAKFIANGSDASRLRIELKGSRPLNYTLIPLSRPERLLVVFQETTASMNTNGEDRSSN